MFEDKRRVKDLEVAFPFIEGIDFLMLSLKEKIITRRK